MKEQCFLQHRTEGVQKYLSPIVCSTVKLTLANARFDLISTFVDKDKHIAMKGISIQHISTRPRVRQNFYVYQWADCINEICEEDKVTWSQVTTNVGEIVLS